MSNFTYCAVIRTLGKAGEKYQRELNSLCRQTVSPEKILVYIPEGYELPKETCGREVYIRSTKGMIAQRSLPFKEVDTEYILFLDDDVELPANGVEHLLQVMKSEGADCIIPRIYRHDKDNFFQKIFGYFHSGQLIHHDRKWDVKIRRDGAFSFYSGQCDETMPTQSGAGACCLCRVDAYQAIHFDDERWLDNFRFSSGDDQLFYYKMFIHGFKLMSVNNTGIVHLDARSAGRPDISLKQRYQKAIAFIIWWRTQYEVRGRGKIRCVAAYAWRVLMGMLFCPVEAVYYHHSRFVPDFFRGILDGWRYVHSDKYRRLLKFDAYRKGAQVK